MQTHTVKMLMKTKAETYKDGQERGQEPIAPSDPLSSDGTSLQNRETTFSWCRSPLPCGAASVRPPQQAHTVTHILASPGNGQSQMVSTSILVSCQNIAGGQIAARKSSSPS